MRNAHAFMTFPFPLGIQSGRMEILGSICVILLIMAILGILVFRRGRKWPVIVGCMAIGVLAVWFLVQFHTGYRCGRPGERTTVSVGVQWTEDGKVHEAELTEEEQKEFFEALSACRIRKDRAGRDLSQEKPLESASEVSVEIRFLEGETVKDSVSLQLGSARGTYSNDLWIFEDQPLIDWWESVRTGMD
ncbi:MAG: hypothetical protein IJR36_08940 [Lachnospiraceae bacterium]|nr:hypothetical protein [Lachnospiraceae bacterium]MBQ9562403.1 hypothetical protein [Lachnospiraceae bacterium]MBQ9593986.1 hypothetical protein [Lachnospiraceae bacterium]MBR0152180.1 hypothetical protein [Lachnospiraceae bacterium]